MHVHKLALVNEDRDYEDGTEIAFIRGPGEDGAHLIEPERGQGTKVLFCYEPEKGDTHMALFRPNESGKPKERWEIKEYSDGYYVIFNQKTARQLLYCDDAKDERGNRRVQMGPAKYENDGSDRWIFQLMKNARKKNADPTKMPKVPIAWNAFGRVMKSKDGPACSDSP